MGVIAVAVFREKERPRILYERQRQVRGFRRGRPVAHFLWRFTHTRPTFFTSKESRQRKVP